MAQEMDVVDSVRERAHIQQEKDLYVLVSEDTCFVKFAHENRPENQELRDTLTELCEAVSRGLQRLKARKDAECSKMN